MSDIDRIERAIERLTDSLTESEKRNNDKMDKLTDAITGLTVSQSAFYEHRESMGKRMDKYEEKQDKIIDRLTDVEIATGNGKMLDSLAINKLKNSTPWLLSALSIAVAIYAVISQ